MKNVEFIALPGTGKSTLRKLVIKHLDNNQWLTVEEAFYLAARKNIDSYLRLILKITPASLALRFVGKIDNRSQWQQEAQSLFLAKYGKALSYILTSKAYHCSSLTDRQIGIHAFLGIGSQHECIQAHGFSDKNILLDEGLVQKSLMFIPTQNQVDNSNDEKNFYGYLNNIPKPDVLIFIKTSIDNSLRRMHSRPEGLIERLHSQNDEKIHSFLSRSSVHLENTVSNLKENTNIQIITINNDSKPDAAVDHILSALKKL